MAFTQYDPARPNIRGRLGATILKTGVIELTAQTYRALGEPTAVVVDIDPDEYVLRIRPAHPGMPRALALRDRRRFAATGILRELGIRYRDTSTACPGVKVGTGVHIDVSSAPAAARWGTAA